MLQVQTKRSVQRRRPGTALLSARGRHRSSGRQWGRGHLIPARLHRKTGQFADSGLPSPQSAKKDFFNTIRQKLSVEECPGWVCAVQRRRFPVGANPIRQPLQPEAIGAVMEVTKWLKPSISVSRIGDSASVQAATRVNAEQASKRTMRRSTRQPFRGRLIRLDEMSEGYVQTLRRGSDGGMYTRKAHETREAPRPGQR